MDSRWVTGTLAVLLVGTGIWGYRQYQDKQALELKTENQYQNSFHNLASHMDLLQDELGKSLAVQTDRNMSPTLANTWRYSYIAQRDLSQLPLISLNLNKTQDFLQRVGQLSYELSMHPKPNQSKTLSVSDWNNLHQLYQQSSDVEQEIRGFQTKILDQNLRFSSAESVMQEQRQKSDNQIVDGFKALENKVSQFPEVHSESLDALKTRNNFDLSTVDGTPQSADQIVKKVAAFLNRGGTDGITAVKNGSGARFPSYTVTVQNQNQAPTYLGVMEKGGHIVWMTQDKTADHETLDLEQAQKKAEQWVNNHGFSNMAVIKTDQYDHATVYQFACTRNQMIYYPCSLTVKVVLDDGSITGLNAQDYIFHHKDHQVPTVQLNRSQALAKVNPHVNVEESRLAQILDDNGKPVNVWEVLGTLDNNTYKIYVNAATGVEERVEKLKQEGISSEADQNVEDGVNRQSKT